MINKLSVRYALWNNMSRDCSYFDMIASLYFRSNSVGKMPAANCFILISGWNANIRYMRHFLGNLPNTQMMIYTYLNSIWLSLLLNSPFTITFTFFHSTETKQWLEANVHYHDIRQSYNLLSSYLTMSFNLISNFDLVCISHLYMIMNGKIMT